MSNLILRYTFLILLLICEPLAAQAVKPNVVLVMADDIGLGDISFYRRQRTDKEPVVATPNIDQLAMQGMHFSDAHSPASLCAPTRFSMLTGNYSYRNARPLGVWTPESDALIDPDFTTIARIAKAGGYSTAFFGKWGLGGVWPTGKTDYATVSAGALSYGFDDAVELPQGIQNKPFVFYENRQWMKLKPDSVLIPLDPSQTYPPSPGNEMQKSKASGGIGDSNWNPALAGPILASKAVAYIEKQTLTRPGDPFFIYYCSQAVHIPHAPSTELDGVSVSETTPGYHGDMIRELDVQVGMIVKALQKAGVDDNTLFIFTSDNGGLGIDRAMVAAGHVASNGLRGHKGSIYEGGHRVPFIAVWPGKIPPNSQSREPIVGLDVVATIAALANQPLDRSIVKDSANLLPIFSGEAQSPVHDYLMHQSASGPSYALRDGDWKLIVKAKTAGKSKRPAAGKLEDIAPIALFNLNDNVAENESQNLIHDAKYNDRIEAMFAKYKQLRASGVPTVADM